MRRPSSIFESKTVLNRCASLDKLESEFAAKERNNAAGCPLMMLASGGDYSVAPPVKEYPSALLQQWTQQATDARCDSRR